MNIFILWIFPQIDDDLNIAQSYLEQGEKIKDLEKEISEARKKDNLTSDDMVRLQEMEIQLAKERDAYADLAWIKTDLDAAYREAVRLADMTELERQVEEYNARKAQRLAEYEEKKAQLTKELNDAKVQAINLITTYNDMKEAIMEQYKTASEYYQQTIETNTLKTKDNAEKMVEYYNQVADAIKNTVKELKSLESMGGTASMIQIPEFATGGIVPGAGAIDSVLARVSPGELILNRSQQENIASQLQSQGGGNVYITFVPTIYGDNEEYAQKIGDIIVSELKNHTRTESY